MSEGPQTLSYGQTKDNLGVSVYHQDFDFRSAGACTVSSQIPRFTAPEAGGDRKLAMSNWNGPYQVIHCVNAEEKMGLHLALWNTILPHLARQDDFPRALFKW